MKKQKISKIITVIILGVLIYIIGYSYIESILVGEEKCLQWLHNHKCLTVDGVVTMPMIEYELLSSNYKSLFTEDEYNNISTTDDIYNLFIKVNTIKDEIKLKKDDLYITGWRNDLSGELHTKYGNYYVEYNIWFRVQPFTSDIKIVKWTIDMKELHEDKNIAETSEE